MAKEVFGSKNSIGEVQIASDVVSAIAGISAAEVDGVPVSYTHLTLPTRSAV